MNRTYFKLGSNTIRVGLTSYFDNEWLFGNAIDVTVGKTDGPPQMWATMTFRRDGKDLVLFRPRADGIVDIDQKNYDDWSAVAWGLCQTLVNSDTTFIDPVRCPKRPF
jgi:hypothetical protein